MFNDSIEKKVLKYLGFLIKNHHMQFSVQIYDSFLGFAGPIELFCFYNDNGCFSLQHIVQKGEWGCFSAKKFSVMQNDLLENEISQKQFANRNVYTSTAFLRLLSSSIQKQIANSGSFFGIAL